MHTSVATNPVSFTGAPAARTRDMPNERPRELPRFIAIWPVFASRWSFGVGAVVLFGWAFGLDPLKRVLPGFVAMNPATAVFFILCGAALELLVLHPASRQARLAARIFALVVLFGAVCELIELTGFWHSLVDEILFSGSLAKLDNGLPNRMAPNTALNFSLLAGALLMLDSKRHQRFAEAITIVAAFAALLPITGYAYGVQSFRGVTSFIPMALHTAATFVILSGGIFFAVRDAAMTEVFSSTDARGVLARRLLPAAIGLTLFLGWVRIAGETHDWYEPAFGTALYAVTLAVLLTALVRWSIAAVGRLEAERAAINARLAALNRRKDEMIAVVSHDLCSPLTGFRMVIDLLRDRNEPTEDLLNLMDQSARRMVAMVRGLLDVSKLQSDETQLEPKNLILSELIRHSLQPLKINADAKQITLELKVADAEPVIYADPLRVTQIFNNLLTNAVKFTDRGGRVSVLIEPEENGVSVSVRDTGLGIPGAELEHIFEKFHQTTTKATGGEVGAGLGLAIVRELVLLHEGKISVTSEVGEGTTFTVYLPQRPARHVEQPTLIERVA